MSQRRRAIKWNRPRFLMSPNCLMTFNRRHFIHVHEIQLGLSQPTILAQPKNVALLRNQNIKTFLCILSKNG